MQVESNHLERYVEVDDNVDGGLGLQRLRLRQSAREPVKQPVLLAQRLQLGGDEADHHVVGNEVAAVDEGLGLLAQSGLVIDVLTQQVARADVLQLETKVSRDAATRFICHVIDETI